MFASGGFHPRPDIAGITLNRWGHAYVNPQPQGRIAFANTDQLVQT